MAAQDNPYGGAINLPTRRLTLLSAEGLIVRGRPRGGWTSTQFTWSAADRTELSADVARTELARRWLLAFGPAQAADLQWWTGWAAGQGRQALSQLEGTQADLRGATGIMLAAHAGEAAAVEPGAAPRPAPDPTAVGRRHQGG